MKILAIDDNSDDLISLKAILQDAFPDSVFYSAINGPKGIELAIAVDPDVILLDIIMPQMDGFEVCRQLKQNKRLCDIPVVFLTAMKEDRYNRIKALDAGGEAFLYKPIDEIELTAQIRAMIKIKESNRFKRNENERLALLVNERSLQLEQKQLELINLLVELKTENESRKAIEEELRVSEEKYRTLFETMPQGVVYQNADGVVIFANKSAGRILGLTIDQMMGRTSIDPRWKAIHEDGSDFPGDTHPNSISLKTGKETKNVVMGIYNPKNESYCWINVSAIPQFKPGESKPYQVYTTFDDITERMLTGETLNVSEARLRRAELASKSGNWELHLDNGTMIASEGAEKIYGVEKNRFEYEVIKQFPLPEYRSLLDNALKMLMEEDKPYDIEFKIKTADTVEIKDIHSVAIFDKDKRVLFGVINDITERKKNEAAMLEAIAQASRFRKALDNVSAFIYIKDDQSRYVYANLPTLELFQCTADELIGSDDMRFFPPETVIQLREVDRRILDYGEDTAKEIESFSAEGNRQVYWEVKTPIYDETNNNRVWGICGISTDITERKQAEEALKESEAKFRTLFTQMNEGFALHEVIYDEIHTAIDYRIIEINNAFEKQIGISTEKAKGALATVLYGVSPAPYLDTYANVAETGDHRFFQSYFPPLDKYFEISVFAPKPGYFATIFTDITERKKTEVALHDSEEKYRILFNISPDAYLIIIDGIFVDCNRATGIMMGGDRMQIIGQSPEALSPEFQPDGQKSSGKAAVLIEKAFLTGQCIFEWVHCRLDGSEFTVEVIIVPMVFEGKQALFTTWRDITERKHAEEALRENEIRLREAIATKDKFFSIIAHDLKNPFNSILGFSELLVERVSEQNYESIVEYSAIIQNSSQRVMDLLMNLLEWSRSQTGRMEFNPEFVDMVVLLNQVRELLDDSAHQKAISIELEIPRNAPVIADKAMISTVVRNLISNAIKFTGPGGAITITLVQNQKELMVSVADNGLGIKRELINNLFKIEKSQSMPGTNNEKGTGLGLILCKEFVEKHGGKIWVESEPGKGSTFYFSIPNIGNHLTTTFGLGK